MPPPPTPLLSLDLSRNFIKSLSPLDYPSSPLLNLTSLDLSRNFLRALPTSLSSLKSLVTLNASSNDLRYAALSSLLKTSLSGLNCLRSLDLQHNNHIGTYNSDHSSLLSTSLSLPLCSLLLTSQSDPSKKPHAADRDATLLLSQIAPHATSILRRRLALVFGDVTDPETADRKEVLRRLHVAHELRGPRAVRLVQGAQVSEPALVPLLAALSSWTVSDTLRREDPKEARERPTVNAQHYMIVSSPLAFSDPAARKGRLAAKKMDEHREMWVLAIKALLEVDPDFVPQVTAIAFTKNFTGSPHIDTENVGPFYGLALGDFEGGRLCVECSATEVAAVDTKGKLGKVDGRFPHWVAPFTGTRYSVIFYKTRGTVVERTTAVFKGTPLVNECSTYCEKVDNYFNCYDKATGKYEPRA